MGNGQAWSRTRIVAILVAAAAAALTLVGGAVAAVALALSPTDDATTGAQPGPRAGGEGPIGPGGVGRDAIAAAPMLEVSPADATDGAPSTTLPDTMLVPNPTEVGSARVATGFPATPQGAVGQLGAILVDVVQSMSIPRAHEVHRAWTEPGAGAAKDWVMTRNVAAFLHSAGLSGQEAGTRARVEVVPAAAQIKGVDGGDWVVACVLLDMTASIDRTIDVAYGHCERMTWQQGRWVIAAGDPPAPAPSTWPGTDLAAEAGWLTWQPETP